MLLFFFIKAGTQLQYLNLKAGRKAGSIGDFLKFSFNDPLERQKRWEAFLMFPMFYAVVMDDESEELLKLKLRVKRLHIAIYLTLIILIILGVYSDNPTPATA